MNKGLSIRQAAFVSLLLASAHVNSAVTGPTVAGSSERDQLVSSKSWQRIDNLSDEFEGSSLDGTKWDNRGVIPGRFYWLGRYPGMFEDENVSVQNGELWLEAEKFDAPREDFRGVRDDWTHGGAIVRSHNLVTPGTYIEASMKTTDTIMSGTFWLMMPNADCKKLIKKELDITESIGRRSGVYRPIDEKHPKQLSWYEPTSIEFESGINPTARQRKTDCLPAHNVSNKKDNTTDFNPSEDFHVYGLYWKSPTELYFYVDGEYQFEITPSVPFEDPMAIVMATETYDFNWPSGDDVADGFRLENGQPRPLIDRASRYQWVRTWKVVE
ncbi:family 16 glycosylhydrolase [Vibrio sp. WXL103]|uniref:family 16 glycosylhydrolase n=1 Tax=unclassified Vibrio TaxID=2614977 RepID=UPI003EC5BBA7